MTDASDLLLPTSLERRRLMVDRQVRTFDVTDQIITGRLLEVPRELFVDHGQQSLAYSDSAIELSGDAGPRARTLLPPFILARMLQAAEPQPTDRALDIAGGTGYTAALLAGLVSEVVAVETDGALFARAKAAFSSLGLRNVSPLSIPVSKLGVDLGPFDLIVINGCVEDHLPPLADLLSPKGRIVAIVPKASGMTMAALISGTRSDLSVRPLFDAQAPVIEEFRRAAEFAF